MLNQAYRLISPKLIRIDFIDEITTKNQVIVRPKYLSICAADIRYYTGKRSKKVLQEKLPMALIHEAVGEVLYDPNGNFKIGSDVVLIPNNPLHIDSVIKENYLSDSNFSGSGYDGFMQNLVYINKNRVIKYSNIEPRTAVLLELVSVAMNALEFFQKYSHGNHERIAIWGNGNLGFVTSLILKKTFPKSTIIVFGTRQEKLNYFAFADETYISDNIPDNIKFDHAFECVGGEKAEDVINQIIEHINPQGMISLMGVSEEKVALNTRMILEKGLMLLGNSRSGFEDFKNAIAFLEENEEVREYLNTIISEEIVVKNVHDINVAFDRSLVNEFKTIMKWEI